MYFDSAYIAKFYLKEQESAMVRDLVRHQGPIRTSALALTEVHCTFHRSLRENRLSAPEVRELAAMFNEDVDDGVWILSRVPEGLLRRAAALVMAAPANTFLRSADTIHLATAQELGEREIWTSDRHMLAAAPFFGLSGRTV